MTQRREMPQRRWQDFGPRQKAALVVLASAQVALAVSAWADLAARPAARVSGGRKPVWAAIIAVNFVGPIAYFTKGRRAPGASPVATVR